MTRQLTSKLSTRFMVSLFLMAGALVLATPAARPVGDDTAEGDQIFDAYLAGPGVYEAIRGKMKAMDWTTFMTTLIENERYVKIFHAGKQSSLPQYQVRKKLDTGEFEDIATVDAFNFQNHGITPDDMYKRAGLERMIREVLAEQTDFQTSPDIVPTLADIFEKGPEEGVRIAKALKSGIIRQAFGQTTALRWLLLVGGATNDPQVYGTAAAWLRDPAFRQARDKEVAPTPIPARESEIIGANQLLVITQADPAVKRRGLIACLLGQNRTHSDQNALLRLRYITLSRMKKWDGQYPETELERVGDKLGILGRSRASFAGAQDALPVRETHLPTTELELDRCPYVSQKDLN